MAAAIAVNHGLILAKKLESECPTSAHVYLSEMQRFLPPDVSDRLEEERRNITREIIDLLSTPEITTNNGKFMLMIRRIGQLDAEGVLYDLDWLISCIEKTWELFCAPQLSMVKKSRICDIIVTLLGQALKHFPVVWETRHCCSELTRTPEKKKAEIAAIIPYEQILEILLSKFSRGYRADVGTSSHRGKILLMYIHKIVSYMKHFWDAEAVGNGMYERIMAVWISVKQRNEMFLWIRLFYMFAAKEFCYKMVMDGRLFKLWTEIDPATINSWDMMMIAMLQKAAQQGWAIGKPINAHIKPYMPALSEMVSRTLHGGRSGLGAGKDTVPGEYSVLLPKTPDKLMKLVVYVLTPLSEDTKKSPSISEQERNLYNVLKTGFAVVAPFMEPTNSGKIQRSTSTAISNFVSYYCNRVHRERLSPLAVRESLGRQVSGPDPPALDDGEPVVWSESNRLGEREDSWVIRSLEPLLLQGVYSKDSKVVGVCEDALKHLCYLRPQQLLPTLVERCLKAFETVTQTHQIATSMRMLTVTMPLVFRCVPQYITPIFQSALPGIDISDPQKTICALSLFFIILSQMPFEDLSGMSISDKDVHDHLEMRRKFRGRISDFGGNYPPESKCASSTSKKPPAPSENMSDPETFQGRRELVDARRMSSSLYPELAESLFKQMLKLVNGLGGVQEGLQSSSSSISKTDRLIITSMKTCCLTLSQQVDSQTGLRLLEQLKKWIFETNSSNPKFVGLMVGSFQLHDPMKMVDRIFLPIFKTLYDESTDKLRSGVPETQQRRLLSVVSAIVRRPVTGVIAEADKVRKLVRAVLAEENKKTWKLGAKIMRRLIESQLIQQPNDTLLVPQQFRNTEKIKKLYLLGAGESWLYNVLEGAKTNEDFMGIEWNEVTEENVRIAHEQSQYGFAIAEEFIRLAFSKISQEKTLIDGDSRMLSSTEDARQHKGTSGMEKPIGLMLPTLPAISDEERKDVETIVASSSSSLSAFRILLRGITVARVITKALSSFYLDERPAEIVSVPYVHKHSHQIAEDLLNTVGQCIISLFEMTLGLSVDERNLVLVEKQRLWQSLAAEEGKLQEKLLRLLEQVVLRHWAYYCPRGRAGINAFSTFATWFSPTAVIHVESLWQTLSRIWWLERICYEWCGRLERRRVSIKATGMRRSLLGILTHLTMYFYPNVRNYAQDVLHDCFSQHYGARTEMTNVQLSYLRSHVQRKEEKAKEEDNVSRQDRLVVDQTAVSRDSSAVEDAVLVSTRYMLPPDQSEKNADESVQSEETSQVEVSDQPNHRTHAIQHRLRKFKVENAESTEDDLRNARLLGISYNLDNGPALRRIWGYTWVLADLLHSIAVAFDSDIKRADVLGRLFSLAGTILTYRELIVRDKEFEVKVIRELCLQLLENVQSSDFSTWRYELVSTAIVSAFMSPPPLKTAWLSTLLADKMSVEQTTRLKTSVMQDGELVDLVLSQWCTWLLKAISGTPLLIIVSAHSLSVLLKAFRKHPEWLPMSFLKELHSYNTLRNIFAAVVVNFHDTIRGGPSRINRYPKPAHSLAVEMARLEKTWPHLRYGRASSTYILHNVILLKSIIQMLEASAHLVQVDLAEVARIEKENGVAEGPQSWPAYLRYIHVLLVDLDKAPQTEQDKFVAISEVTSSLVRESRRWSHERQASLWKRTFQPILVAAFKKASPERLRDWMDAFWYMVESTEKLNVDDRLFFMRNIINFVFEPDRVDPCLSSWLTPKPIANTPVSEEIVEDEPSDEASAHSIVSSQQASIDKMDSEDVANAPPSPELTKHRSTFDDIKRMSVLRTVIRTLGPNTPPEALRLLLEVLFEAFFHPYQQAREEVQKLLVTIRWVVYTFRRTVSEELREIDESIRQHVLRRIREIIPFVASDTSTKADWVHGQGRPKQLVQAEAIMHHYLMSAFLDSALYPDDARRFALPLALLSARHADTDLAYAGHRLASLVARNSRRCGITDPLAQPCLGDDIVQLLRNFVTMGDEETVKKDTSSLLSEVTVADGQWKIRKGAVKLAEAFALYMRLFLLGTSDYRQLFEICILALRDRHVEVRNCARQALTGIIMGLSEDDCRLYTKRFQEIAGNSRSMTVMKSSSREAATALSGVLGLCALVESVPYTVPKWLPETLCILAPYANEQAPDVIRKTVQKCLQEFSRTHQDAWIEVHILEFTREQIDILETYKGRPAYFS